MSAALPWSGRSVRTGAAMAFASLFMSQASFAAPPKVCTSSYDQAQVLRRDGHLLQAREQLRVCAQSSCPGLVVSDCTQWLDEVTRTLPSVVPVLVDGGGADLANVTVSIDGGPELPVSGVRPIDIDPGSHHFAFSHLGSPPVSTDVVVALGERSKRVSATLPGAAPGSPASDTSRSPLWTAGIVIGAAGVVGLGVGAGFGAAGLAEKSDANCPNNVCHLPTGNPSTLHSAWTDGNISTAAFIAGGVLAAAGVTLWLLAPSPHREGAVSLQASPLTVMRGGGLALGGAFW